MFKSYGDFNFQRNQLINAVLHKATTDPSNGTEGQIYFNTTSDKIMYYDGLRWKPISSSSSQFIAEDAITIDVDNSDIDDPIYNIGINVNDAHLVIEPDPTDPSINMVSIKKGAIVESLLADQAVSTDKIKKSGVTTIKIADKAVTFTKMQNLATMTVIGNMSANTTTPSEVKVLTDLNSASSSASELATAYGVKTYIDSKLSTIGELKGSWDPNSGVYPGSTTTKKGDYWYVIADGTINQDSYDIGDLIIANMQAAGNNVNHYIALETNRDKASTTTYGYVKLATQEEALSESPIPEDKVITVNTLINRTATEERAGIIELATQEEAESSTDTTRALTSKTATDLINKLLNQSKFSSSYGNGDNTYLVTHNIDSLTPQVTFYEETTKEFILCPYTITDNNSITFTATPAPTLQSKIVVVVR